MAETYECFKVEVADHVATVTLARPPVNAQNRRFREEIIAIFDTLSDRADVRAVVLTGDGKTFSAGADLKERPGLERGDRSLSAPQPHRPRELQRRHGMRKAGHRGNQRRGHRRGLRARALLRHPDRERRRHISR